MSKLTVKDSIEHWKTQVLHFFDHIAAAARQDGWSETLSDTDVQEDPYALGASISYRAPVLVLRRSGPQGTEQRVTFEPRHRFTLGAAGRIDVYSSPAIRDAMLLRTANTENAENLTFDEVEERVAEAPWRAFSVERMPLAVDFNSDSSIVQFLQDLAA